jgi:hypothetical protein
MNELNSIRSEVRAAGLRPSRRMPTPEAVSKLTSPLQQEKEMSSFPKPSASSCGKQKGGSLVLGKSSGSKFSKIGLDKKSKLGELAIAELLLQVWDVSDVTICVFPRDMHDVREFIRQNYFHPILRWMKKKRLAVMLV